VLALCLLGLLAAALADQFDQPGMLPQCGLYELSFILPTVAIRVLPLGLVSFRQESDTPAD